VPTIKQESYMTKNYTEADPRTDKPPRILIRAANQLREKLAGTSCLLCQQPNAQESHLLLSDKPTTHEVATGTMRFVGIALCNACVKTPHHGELAGELAFSLLNRSGIHSVEGIAFVDLPLGGGNK
jgi:hypothetical protein